MSKAKEVAAFKEAVKQKYDFLFENRTSKDYFWVAGGCLLSTYLNEPIKDIDIWSPDPSRTIALFEHDGAEIIKENDIFCDMKYKGHLLQIIKKYQFDCREYILNTFDFTCVSAAYSPEDGLLTDPEFYKDAKARKLVFNNIKKPVSSFKRVMRYIKDKNFTIDDEELKNLFAYIQESNIEFQKLDGHQWKVHDDY